jgi:branched-chain amino acid transport system substrate-binding protein
MLRGSRSVLPALLGLLLWFAPAISAEVDAASREADSLYLAGNYREAASIYVSLAAQEEASEKERYQFLAAKAYYRSGDYRNATDLFNQLLPERPPSYIKAAANFYLGNIAFEANDYVGAAHRFIDAYEADRDTSRRQLYLESLAPLFAHHMSLDEGNQVYASVGDSELRNRLFCPLAEKYFAEHRYEQLIDQIDRQFSSSREVPCRERLDWLLQQSHLRKGHEAAVGLLVPQSGSLAPYGTSILEATTLALEDYREQTGQTVALDTANTKGDVIGAAMAAKEIAKMSVPAVLGPLTSQAAAAVVSHLNCFDIPVVSPTAAESGLTAIGDNFFQMTPSVGTLARILGKFVAGDLTLDSVAIIYPDDAHGRQAAAAFTEVAESLGTDVFFSRSFVPTAADFRDILMDMKNLILPDTFDTTIFVDESGDTLEAEAVPVFFKAIYIPAAESQLELIIPQVNFYKISTTFLGGGAWGSSQVTNMPELSTRDVFFVDDLFSLPGDRDYNYFYNRYHMRFGHPPDLVAARAYDTARMLFAAFASAGAAPEGISDYLEQHISYSGVSGRIHLNANHENDFASIYWISDGKITREK